MDSSDTTIAITGPGYVGLPLAIEFGKFNSRDFTHIENIAQRVIYAQQRYRRSRSDPEHRVALLPFLECAVPHVQPRRPQPSSAFRPDPCYRVGALPAAVAAGRRARQLRRRERTPGGGRPHASHEGARDGVAAFVSWYRSYYGG